MNINLRVKNKFHINAEFNNASDAIESLGYTEIANHDQGGNRYNIYTKDGEKIAYREMAHEGRFIRTITYSPEVIKNDKKK